MDGKVCPYRKFGYCKFQEECKMKHLEEVCDKNLKCKNIKECHKRHPRNCKRFTSEDGCRFNEDCAYSHQVNRQDEEQKKFKEKVDILEEKVGKLDQLDIVIKALTQKVISLEHELEILKKLSKPSGACEEWVKEIVLEKKKKYLSITSS